MPEGIQVVVTTIRLGSHNTNLYSFERLDGGALPACDPGAHIALHLPEAMERQYSLVQAHAHPTAYVIGVKREANGRGGSAWIHDHLRVGMTLWIDPPRNNFPLKDDAPFSVLIAGGIGITPIYCMAQRLKVLARPFELHYACRSRLEAIFLRELSGWPNVHIRFDEENEGRPFPISQVVAAAPPGAHLYCCGPTPMLTAFEQAGAAARRPPGEIHVEYFVQKFESATEGGFTVELARSKIEVVVPPGKSILNVLLEAGVYVSHSCSEGVCGSCETTVLSGVPDHRDALLSEEERASSATMMICCSGSKSPKLVLDL